MKLIASEWYKSNKNKTIYLGGFLIQFYNFTTGDNVTDDLVKSRLYSNGEPTDGPRIPAWIISESKSVNDNVLTDYTIYFYVPRSLTSNSPFGFSLLVYNPIDEKLKILFYSSSNQTQYTVTNDYGISPYNQGIFNTGWNSINFSLDSNVCKLVIDQIHDFKFITSSQYLSECLNKYSQISQILFNPEIKRKSEKLAVSKLSILELLRENTRNSNKIEIINGNINITPKIEPEILDGVELRINNFVEFINLK